ncbi:hypothetical protein NSQ95_10155 [Psychrobacillus sp. FSL W7-1457]|uniref:hypothetical protein n=1 Tax=unclassified Psychrobacillus TaxID=2636677 RepID=UPI0030F8D396
MRMNKIGMVFLMVILILTACNVVGKDRSKENVDNSSVYSENRDDKAKIQKVNTDLEVEHGWHIVPEGIKKITISMEAENVETILFWIAPTGTETWGERTLIGYDIDGNDGWSIEWEFGDRIFHDHITIQALGSDYTTQASETLNIHSVDENQKE